MLRRQSLLLSISGHALLVLGLASFAPSLRPPLAAELPVYAVSIEPFDVPALGDPSGVPHPVPEPPKEKPIRVQAEPVKSALPKATLQKKREQPKPTAPVADPSALGNADSAPPVADTTTGARAQLGSGGSARAGGGTYESVLRTQLTRAKRYPERARRRGIEGAVVVEFVVNRDGTIREPKIAQPADSEFLNMAALEMLERATPFPAPPDDYRPGEELAFRIPVQFRLQ